MSIILLHTIKAFIKEIILLHLASARKVLMVFSSLVSVSMPSFTWVLTPRLAARYQYLSFEQYVPTLFSQAGLSSTTSSFLASGVSGILTAVITFCCQWFQDKCKMSLLLTSSALLSRDSRATSYPNDRRFCRVWSAMLIIGSIYLSRANNTESGRTAIICFIYIFIAGFISSWAIVCRIVCNEVQPTQTHAAVSSLGQCADCSKLRGSVLNTAVLEPLYLGSVLFVRWMFLVEHCCMLSFPTGVDFGGH